jgi:hypothetical protein
METSFEQLTPYNLLYTLDDLTSESYCRNDATRGVAFSACHTVVDVIPVVLLQM